MNLNDPNDPIYGVPPTTVQPVAADPNVVFSEVAPVADPNAVVNPNAMANPNVPMGIPAPLGVPVVTDPDDLAGMVAFATEPAIVTEINVPEVEEVEVGGGDEARNRLIAIRYHYHDGRVVDIPVNGGFIEPSEDFTYWVDCGSYWACLHPMSPVRAIQFLEVAEKDEI